MRITANRGLAIMGGAVIIICIVLAALASSWTVEPRDPKSPEGVVQAYMQAVMEHKPDAALGYLETDTRCTISNYQQVGYDYAARVNLVDVSIQGDNATVHVRMEHTNGDPFGGTWSEEQYFQLVRFGDGWRIHGTPWPVWNCEVPVK